MKHVQSSPQDIGNRALYALIVQKALLLRSWLAHLAERGKLAVAREGVELADELAAISKRLERDRAVLFPKPGGHDIPVVANLFAARDWVAESIGVGADQLLGRFLAAARDPLPSREVSSGPVQEIVHNEVDLLRQLPIPKHNERDSGPYITAGLLIARNPRNGIQNVSIHRCQISGPNRIGVLLLPRHTLSYFRMAEEAGEALEIAVVIGVHPALLLASLTATASVPLAFAAPAVTVALMRESRYGCTGGNAMPCALTRKRAATGLVPNGPLSASRGLWTRFIVQNRSTRNPAAAELTAHGRRYSLHHLI